MPPKTAMRIVEKIEAFATNPESQRNNVKRLVGRDEIRLRIGDWRAILVDGDVIDVVRIGPRGSIYER